MHALGQLDTSPSQTSHPSHDPADDEDPASAEAAALGLVLERPQASAAMPVFCLWPECVGAWAAWVSVQTQWRYSGMASQPTGLDYAGVTAWLQAHGYGFGRARNLRETLGHIGAMERAALIAYAEQADKKAPAHG